MLQWRLAYAADQLRPVADHLSVAGNTGFAVETERTKPRDICTGRYECPIYSGRLRHRLRGLRPVAWRVGQAATGLSCCPEALSETFLVYAGPVPISCDPTEVDRCVAWHPQ